MLQRLLEHRFRRTSLVIAGLSGVLAGLVWARFGMAASAATLIAGFASFPLLARRRWFAVLAAAFIGLNLGLWRGSVVFDELQNYQPLYGQEVILHGQVSDDAAYADRGQTEFHINNVQLQEPASNMDLPGRVRVRSFGAVGVRRGDVVVAAGRLYEGFGNRQGSLSFAEVEVLSRDPGLLEDIRARFFAGVYTAIPEPSASLGLGFLVGLRTLLPESLLEQLSATGLTHIVAVSGYNLTILVKITRRMFAKRSIFVSLATSVTLIIGFLLVTGVSPSISRAAVVSGFALAAWYYGRPISPIMLILLGAAITGAINPFFVWFDLGWYLSFSAFVGVLILAPLLTRRFFKKTPRLFGQIMIETTSAQIMALPIIAVVFGELSLISILANIAILPLIPLAMLLTFIAGLAGMAGPLLAGWFAWPANLLLTFMTDLIQLMAQVPWALTEVVVSWTSVSLFYGLVVFIALLLYFRTKKPLRGTELIE